MSLQTFTPKNDRLADILVRPGQPWIELGPEWHR